MPEEIEMMEVCNIWESRLKNICMREEVTELGLVTITFLADSIVCILIVTVHIRQA